MLEQWDSADEEVKESYGREYFEAFAASIVGVFSTASPAVYEVIDDIEDAVIGITPKVEIADDKDKVSIRYAIIFWNPNLRTRLFFSYITKVGPLI